MVIEIEIVIVAIPGRNNIDDNLLPPKIPPSQKI